MTRLQTRVKVNPEGNVVIAVGREEAGRDVVVTVESVKPKVTQEQWQRIVRETAGSAPHLERPPQGEYEKREPLE